MPDFSWQQNDLAIISYDFCIIVCETEERLTMLAGTYRLIWNNNLTEVCKC